MLAIDEIGAELHDQDQPDVAQCRRVHRNVSVDVASGEIGTPQIRVMLQGDEHRDIDIEEQCMTRDQQMADNGVGGLAQRACVAR